MNKNLIFLVILLSIVFPFFANSTWISISTMFMIYAILALSLDVVLGKAGIYSMGHAMFFGIGAYNFAILISHYSEHIILVAIISLIITCVLSFLIAIFTLFLQGDYFLMVSMGLNIIFIQIINNNPFNLTGGPNGIFSLDIKALWGIDFSNQLTMYLIALVFLVLVILLLNNINFSKIGRAIFFINQDDLASQSVGINIVNIKILAFIIGALLASLAGILFVLQNNAISPETFGIEQSILLFAVVIVGGQGSILGVLLGTFIMFVLPEIFRGFAEIRYLIFGILMILLMIIWPKGVLPNKFSFYNRKFIND